MTPHRSKPGRLLGLPDLTTLQSRIVEGPGNPVPTGAHLDGVTALTDPNIAITTKDLTT
jgi:hypothetical protein